MGFDLLSLPEESGLVLERSRPAGKPGGLSEGSIGRDSSRRSPKKPIRSQWGAGSVGPLSCLQAHTFNSSFPYWGEPAFLARTRKLEREGGWDGPWVGGVPHSGSLEIDCYDRTTLLA